MQVFHLIDKGKGVYSCDYCNEIIKIENLKDII
ncbi:MAG: hypothetical protein LBD41_08275 [Clostridiales Family XIII bacterium]|nr:hypothetical protein [Clostridiales Family XIII bacterium]